MSVCVRERELCVHVCVYKGVRAVRKATRRTETYFRRGLRLANTGTHNLSACFFFGVETHLVADDNTGDTRNAHLHMLSLTVDLDLYLGLLL